MIIAHIIWMRRRLETQVILTNSDHLDSFLDSFAFTTLAELCNQLAVSHLTEVPPRNPYLRKKPSSSHLVVVGRSPTDDPNGIIGHSNTSSKRFRTSFGHQPSCLAHSASDNIIPSRKPQWTALNDCDCITFILRTALVGTPFVFERWGVLGVVIPLKVLTRLQQLIGVVRGDDCRLLIRKKKHLWKQAFFTMSLMFTSRILTQTRFLHTSLLGSFGCGANILWLLFGSRPMMVLFSWDPFSCVVAHRIGCYEGRHFITWHLSYGRSLRWWCLRRMKIPGRLVKVSNSTSMVASVSFSLLSILSYSLEITLDGTTR